MGRFSEFIEYKNIEKMEIIFAKSPKENMTSVYGRSGCDYLINFPTYNMNSWANGKMYQLSGIKQNGNFISKAYTGNGFGWNNKFEGLHWCYEAMYYTGKVFDNFIGQMFSWYNGTWNNRSTIKNACIGMGIKPNGIKIAGCTKDSSFAMTSDNFMKTYFSDCTHAMEGDGSYSAQWITPRYKNANTRNVVAYIGIWLKESNPTLPPTNADKEETYMSKDYVNNSNARKLVYETTKWDKQIGSLDPHEKCTLIYEGSNYYIILYYLTGTKLQKVGFVKK